MGEAQYSISECGELGISPSVILESLAVVVKLPAVEFDEQLVSEAEINASDTTNNHLALQTPPEHF